MKVELGKKFNCKRSMFVLGCVYCLPEYMWLDSPLSSEGYALGMEITKELKEINPAHSIQEAIWV